MSSPAMFALLVITLATAILIGAGLVRGITWSLGHNDRFTTLTGAEKASPNR